MKRQTFKSGDYISPSIDRIDVETERGFATSIDGGGYDDDGSFGGGYSGSGISGAGYDDDGYFN